MPTWCPTSSASTTTSWDVVGSPWYDCETCTTSGTTLRTDYYYHPNTYTTNSTTLYYHQINNTNYHQINNMNGNLYVEDVASSDEVEVEVDEATRFEQEQARVREQTRRVQEQTERRERREQEGRERRARELAARERARATLREFLGEERWAIWQERHYVEVRANSGKRYLITPGTVSNVKEINEEGVEIASLCAHPPLSEYDEQRGYLGDLPSEDVYIAQILMLQADEALFRQTANILPVLRGRLLLAA